MTKTSPSQKLISPEALRISECYECGVCTANCPLAKIIPETYNPRTTMLRAFLDPQRSKAQIGPWLCMRCRRCSKRCPQKLSPHELFFHIRTNTSEKSHIDDISQRMDEVTRLLEEELPLPLISGWLCLRPDEMPDMTGKVVEEELMKSIKRHREPHPKAMNHVEKVAVIGSGPAGLAAAYELNKKGYSVTVFEKSPNPGGMLRNSIPDFRLSKDLVDAEIAHLESVGVVIKANAPIGNGISIAKLFEERYKALFVATGAGRSTTLRVQGEQIEGVIPGLEFLRKVKLGEKMTVEEKVAVIGGGNLAIDAARTALRLGGKVTVLYRRSREEMPSDPTDVIRAEKEGLQIQPSCIPRKILAKDGKVAAIECIKTKPGQYDRNGRFLPVPIEGTEFTVEADTVIVAIGQQADLDFLPEKIQVGKGNIIVTNPFTLETSMKGVFAGGDVVSGPASVFEAIYAGWKAAISIDGYLKAESSH